MSGHKTYRNPWGLGGGHARLLGGDRSYLDRTAVTGGLGATRQLYLGRRHLHWPGGVGIKEGFLEEVKTKGGLEV